MATDRRMHLPALALVALLAGCGTTRKAVEAGSKKPPVAEPRYLSGRVLRCNSEHGYVIVECALLPRKGEEATVFRGESPVGRVRFGGEVSFPYATAEIIEGHPMSGDRIRSK